MAESSIQHSPATKERSLLSLLESIDQDLAVSLAADVASGKAQVARNTRKKKPFIAFLMGGHEMALPLESILEIGYLPAVTPLPHLPGWIRGIVQIRGEILSVVDLVVLFGLKEEQSFTAKKSFVLFRHGDMQFCLPVRRITGVVNVDSSHGTFQPPSAQLKADLGGLSEFISGAYSIDDRTVCILDSEKMGTAALIRKWR